MGKFGRCAHRVSVVDGQTTLASAVVNKLCGSIKASEPEEDSLRIGPDGRAYVEGNRRQRRVAERYNRSRSK